MPDGATRAISPKDYTFIWGPIAVKDFAADDAVVIDQEADDWQDYCGIGGEVTMIELTDSRATITVRIPESSPTNQLLDAQRKSHKARLTGPLPTIVKGSGTTTFSAAKCWCLGPPKQRKLSAEVQVVEWRFRVSKLTRIDGFNPEV